MTEQPSRQVPTAEPAAEAAPEASPAPPASPAEPAAPAEPVPGPDSRGWPAVARRIGLAGAAPVLALAFALVISGTVLAITGNNPFSAFSSMYHYGTRKDSVIFALNTAGPYYVSGLAVAVGFKMNLFNIGVEGQYRLAVLLSAAAGAAVALPAPLHVLFIVLVAMAVGSAWAAIAGVLKAARGVSEVISTIMLNTIAFGLTAFLLTRYLKAKSVKGNLTVTTTLIPRSGWLPSLDPLLRGVGIKPPQGYSLSGFLVICVAAGIAYYLLIWRTRFGFDLRATGWNLHAAASSGVRPAAMIVRAMLISGALAGVVGLGPLLSNYHQYTDNIPGGIGFTGIAIALLGRNNPVGVAVGAFLWAIMERSGEILAFNNVPKEIVTILEGVLVLSVVVAYEVVRRVRQAQEERAVARRLARQRPDAEPAAVAA
jgi:simple sugar transport system permease protein